MQIYGFPLLSQTSNPRLGRTSPTPQSSLEAERGPQLEAVGAEDPAQLHGQLPSGDSRLGAPRQVRLRGEGHLAGYAAAH